MRRRKISLITMAVTALVVTLTSAAPASALQGKTVDQTIRAKTGASASRMTAPVKVGDISIGAGRSAGKALDSYTQTPNAKSKRVLAVITDASQSTVTYPVTVPAGTQVRPQADGSLDLVSDEALVVGPPPATPAGQPAGGTWTKARVTTIKAPWAVDAVGKSLPTKYTFANGVLTQKVDTVGASFPVVADPAGWSFGWCMYYTMQRWQVFAAYATASYHNMGLFACGLFGYVPYAGIALIAACSMYAYWVMTSIGQAVDHSAHSVWNGPQACTVVKFAYPVFGIIPVYLGSDYNYCTY
jgi:hypothetical protein